MPDNPNQESVSPSTPTVKPTALDFDAILTVLEDICGILLESLTMQLSVEHRTALEGHMGVLRKLAWHPDPSQQMELLLAPHDKEPADI